MLLKVARAALVALLVLLVAVTPLSALIQPGRFELHFPARDPFLGPGLTVVLDDSTGLVRGLTFAPEGRFGEGVSNLGTDARTLVVGWSGSCGAYLTQLSLERTGSDFRLRERTHDSGCSLLMLLGWRVVIHLWTPIDASTVEFLMVDGPT